MPVFILLLFLGVAVLWLLLSFCFIPIGKFVYRLIKDAKTSMSKMTTKKNLKKGWYRSEWLRKDLLARLCLPSFYLAE